MLNFFDNFTELKSLFNMEGFSETWQIIIFIFTSKSKCGSYISNKDSKEAICLSHSISCSIICKNIQNKHIRAASDENDFDFILHHICWCGHEQSDHKFDILYENISECKTVGCVCRRFFP